MSISIRSRFLVIAMVVLAACAMPRPANAQACTWNQISLFADAWYSAEDGDWTAYGQGDDLAAGCCPHAYNMLVSATTEIQQHTEQSSDLSVWVTRVYDEPGPVDWYVDFSIGCYCINAVVAFDQRTGSLSLPSPSCAIPSNFQKINPYQETYNGSEGTLRFDLVWSSSDSSDTNLGRLRNCRVGEKVDYSSGDIPWPAPYPMNSPPNPTVDDFAGNWGGLDSVPGTARDRHVTPGAPSSFRPPYAAAYLPATQIYRYRCPCTNGNDWVTLMGPHTIARIFEQNPDSSWKYRTTANGAEASIDPIP